MFVKFFVKPKNEIALSFHESGTTEEKGGRKKKDMKGHTRQDKQENYL